MMQWKTDLVNALVEKATTDRVFRFRPVAEEYGHNGGMKAADVREIVTAFCRICPEYKPYIGARPHFSLYNDLFFAEKSIVFCDETDTEC